MRKIIPILALAFLLGCATTTYRTLATVENAVDSAYSGYLSLVVKGQVRTNNVPAISKQYNEVQVAIATAVVLAQFNKSQAPPTNVTTEAAQLLTAIALEKGSK